MQLPGANHLKNKIKPSLTRWQAQNSQVLAESSYSTKTMETMDLHIIYYSYLPNT